MTGFKLLSTILRGAWLIDQRFAEGFFGSVVKMLNGEAVSFYSEEEIKSKVLAHKPFASTLIEGKAISYSSYDEAPAGSVAILTLSGPVMKEDSCGVPGTQTLRKRAIEAYNHPNIGAVMFRMDSGGGSVDGTFELADEIANKKKPVVAWIDGLAASAGYAIISGASEIYASHKTAEIGSIGTAMTLYDNKEALTKMGVKMHYITADSSPEKNADYFKALEGDYESIKKNILNPTNAIFKQTVSSNRDGKVELQKGEPLTGKVYLAERAQELGLIDGIKTFEDALERANELSVHAKINNKQNTMKLKLTSALKSLATLIGVKVEEGKELDTEVTNENLISLNAKLELVNGLENQVSSLNADKLQLTTEINQLTSKVTTLTNDVAHKTKEIDRLTKELATAKTTPGVEITHPIKTGDDDNTETDHRDPQTKEFAELRNFSFEKTKLTDNPSFAKN